MPAVLEQIDGMSVVDKMLIMEHLLKSIAQVVEESASRESAPKGDFSRFAGRWTVEEANEFNAVTARTIDAGDWQ